MIQIEVNGKIIEAKTGETILAMLRRHNIDIPTLCYLENLFPSGACRMCVVEVEGARNLVTACSNNVSPGMKILTHSTRVLHARKTIIELLLSSHPNDCLYCVANNNCELQHLANDYVVRDRRFNGEKNHHKLDHSSPSISRDSDKCILCGRCVRVCEEIQAVSAIDFMYRGCKTQVGTAFNQGLNVSTCINCGQCIMVCPTGALSEKSHIQEVIQALSSPDVYTVVQHAPSVSVTLGESFGFPEGTDICGVMTAALRKMGFKRVFDTGFSADLTIMEESAELISRIKNGGKLPMITSCSPGWIKYMEQSYPDLMEHVSTCKSPQQMMGAVIKSFYAQKTGIDPKKIFSVSIMPCTAKKFEAQRGEMQNEGLSDVDAVLTTRELAKMIHLFGIDIKTLEPELADSPLGQRSTAGKLFGATGGVMEAALRTAYYSLTGTNMDNLTIQPVRDLDGIKESKVTINDMTLGVAVVSGLGNAKKLMDEIRAGRNDIHFIEVMTCPGGCIAGGGQPVGINLQKVRNRMNALYAIDKKEKVRTSHDNEAIQTLYKEFLGEPLSEKSHHLLHTHYTPRKDIY